MIANRADADPQAAAHGGLDGADGRSSKRALPLVAAATAPLSRFDVHECERAEVVGRVAVEAAEAEQRAALPRCDVPTALAFSGALKEAKARLLDGPVYCGLITRQYKREERVLELTFEKLKRLVLAEDHARGHLRTDEQIAAYRLDRYGGLLAYLATAGYSHTTIAVEENEGEGRAGVVAAAEADRELIVRSEPLERELAVQAERQRVERLADARGEVFDIESSQRWNVAEAEEAARIAVESAFVEQFRQLCDRLKWRIVTTEADARWAVESEERSAVRESLVAAACALALHLHDRDAVTERLASAAAGPSNDSGIGATDPRVIALDAPTAEPATATAVAVRPTAPEMDPTATTTTLRASPLASAPATPTNASVAPPALPPAETPGAPPNGAALPAPVAQLWDEAPPTLSARSPSHDTAGWALVDAAWASDAPSDDSNV